MQNLWQRKAKNILKNIILIILVLPIVYFFNQLNKGVFDEYIGNFWHDNKLKLVIFFLSFLMLGLVTLGNYMKSLGAFEVETTETLKASKVNILLWIIYWLSWSYYCASLVLKQRPMTVILLSIIIVIAIAPGLFIFWETIKSRKKNILDKEYGKYINGELNPQWEPSVLNTELKYYSGFYGIICIPSFIIFILIGLLIR